MDKILKDNFEFITNFFENAISKNRLFHSFLLTGNNDSAKYALALNIARILNCEGDKSENCQCLNCKWIRNNAHPAVMTFSPLNFVHVNNKGTSKDRITVNQARFIKDELAKTSTYHRVIIITDAIEGKEATQSYEYLKTLGVKSPVEVNSQDKEDERIWAPKSLTQSIFASETANTLLKTIEEPFENVTFFFIANSVEDVISTIVSRCQVVNVPSCETKNYDFSIIEKIIKNYPAKDNLTAIMLSEHVKLISKENDMSISEILELIKAYYSENLQNFTSEPKKYRQLLTFLNKIEIAETQANRYVNQDSLLENLFF